MQQDKLDAIAAHPRYQELIRSRSRFALTLTFLMLLLYYGFILVIAFAPQWLAIPLATGLVTTVGIPVGVFIIVAAFVLTGIYVSKANGAYDQITKEIQEEFE